MDGKVSLYIDEPETEKILLDFPNYITTLYQLILNSFPQYTVGIFGDWGTGKTTLMNNVKSSLESEGCNCIEFNAWRFAHEERHATYPLMLAILSKILDNKKVKQSLELGKLQKLKTKILRVIKGLKGSVILKVPETTEFKLEVDPSLMTPEEDKISGISEFFEKSKSILHEGLEIISELINEIEGPVTNKNLKLIVFIDDLDRCTPEKAIEVFESVKVFFDIKGIVFVFGLSQDIIEAAINYKYQHLGDSFQGKDYLKKIIQVPFPLPKWSEEDIVKFIDGLLEKNENPEYGKFFQQNKILIAQGVENNPREVKRLLNNFVLSHHIHKKEPHLDMTKLLAVHILSLRWKRFYDIISIKPIYVEEIFPTWKRTLRETGRILADGVIATRSGDDVKIPPGKGNPLEVEFNNDEDLRKFLLGEGKIIFSISTQEWKLYRRATIVEPEIDHLQKIRLQTKTFEAEPVIQILEVNPSTVKQTDTLPFWIRGGSKGKGNKPPSLAKTFELDVNGLDCILFQYYVPVDLKISSNPVSHSSDIKLYIKLDGEDIFVTEWLGYKGRKESLPMETGILGIFNVHGGKHFLTLQPETKGDYLDNWGGTLALYTQMGSQSHLLYESSVHIPSSMLKETGYETKILQKDLNWLNAKVYESIYNDLVRFLENSSNIQALPSNTWEKLDPVSKLKIEPEIKSLLMEYSTELEKWKKMFLELSDGFQINERELGEILKPIFKKAGMLHDDGMIILNEGSRQEPRHWIEAFRIILFDDKIRNAEELYTKLESFSKDAKNGMDKYLIYWKQHFPDIFEYLLNTLPHLQKNLKVTITHDQLTTQMEHVRGIAQKITKKLEERLK